MILGTFSGADYPLNAMPIRDMREVIRSIRIDAQNEIKLCESLKINRARYVAKSRLSSSICSTKKKKKGGRFLHESNEYAAQRNNGSEGRKRSTKRWRRAETVPAGFAEATAALRKDEPQNFVPGHCDSRRKGTNCRNVRSCWSTVGIDFLPPEKGLAEPLLLVRI